MAEEELEALRKQRLAELQAKHGDPGDAAQQEAKHREAEMRNSILAQVLDQSARARLSNLALVKPEKTKAVENYLIQMARYGQLSGKCILESLTFLQDPDEPHLHLKPPVATAACGNQSCPEPFTLRACMEETTTGSSFLSDFPPAFKLLNRRGNVSLSLTLNTVV
ncbi:programmed cell death protein 5 isoform X1 [Meles meles]|uniref:programmed cell death protein 5 isoform X1 n=1 Tax=Meles meles TaxID=9662 RepID=UPI001E69CB8D|nr:programmed cell death protein 5 isoform X1 [Meles meles]